MISGVVLAVFEASRPINASCHPKLKQKHDGSCFLQCGTWTWLPAIEERFLEVLMYLETVEYLASGLIVFVVWLRLRHVL